MKCWYAISSVGRRTWAAAWYCLGRGCGSSCLAAEHCYIAASPEELEHEVVAAEPEFIIMVAGLEKGPHLPEVSEPQESSVGLEAKGVKKIFGHSEQGENRCSS